VRVITPKRLREFWESRTSDSQIAQRDLNVWRKLAESAVWATYGSLKQTFGSADKVGDCIVFDAGNNRYRVICSVSFPKRKVYILKVMDHKEYDKKRWIGECRCYKSSASIPLKASPKKTQAPVRQKKGR
jgi:mRNA interferase HigB